MGRLTPFDWPQQAIRLDDSGRALVLLPLPAGTSRPAARHYVRRALRQILGELLAQSADQIILIEEARGPVLAGAARDIRISLSYAGECGLIGLAEKQDIGVDIVRIDSLPEVESLSRLYLPATACRTVLATAEAARAASFALAWAQMEARCKSLGLPLAEIGEQREQALKASTLVECAQSTGYRIALATRTHSSEHVVILT